MPPLPGLTPELDSAVRNELRDGEELWYSGMPSASRTGRRMWPIALIGLFFGGFAAFWITLAAAGAWFGGATASGDSATPKVVSGVFMLFPLFGVPFLLIGLAMISAPFWAGRMARRTACCVTNRRAMQIACGRSTKVQSWGPEDLHEVTKELHPNGTGSLTFASSLVQGSNGRVRSVPKGFDGIPDPRRCEEALLALKATSRTASGPQTAA